MVKDNYNLKNANELWDEIPEEVKVFGRDDKDYLIFDKNIFVSHECLYIDNFGCQELSRFFTIKENEIHEVEGYYIQSFIVLMLLKISFSEKDGKINRLNAADILNVVRNDCHISLKDVSDKSISREGANKQVISSQADSLIKISRIWADFFPANTSNQPI